MAKDIYYEWLQDQERETMEYIQKNRDTIETFLKKECKPET